MISYLSVSRRGAHAANESVMERFHDAGSRGTGLPFVTVHNLTLRVSSAADGFS